MSMHWNDWPAIVRVRPCLYDAWSFKKMARFCITPSRSPDAPRLLRMSPTQFVGRLAALIPLPACFRSLHGDGLSSRGSAA